jgi:hypothetical protein
MTRAEANLLNEQDGGKKRSKVSRKSSKKSSSKKMSKKVSKKVSKKSRREANPQIVTRGALVKCVWTNLDVKKVAQEKGMVPIGVPAKIVNFVFQEAMKEHPMKEEDKKSVAFWNGVQKTAMSLLKDNLQKYVDMLKK